MENNRLMSVPSRSFKWFIGLIVVYAVLAIGISLVGHWETIKVLHINGIITAFFLAVAAVIMVIYNRSLLKCLKQLIARDEDAGDQTRKFVNNYSMTAAIIMFSIGVIGTISAVTIAYWKGVYPSLQIAIFFFIAMTMIALIVSGIYYFLLKQALYPVNDYMEFKPLTLFAKFFIPLVTPVLLILVMGGLMVFKINYMNNYKLAEHILTNTVSKSNMLLDNVYRRADIELGAYVRSSLFKNMDLEEIREFLVNLHKTKDDGVAVYFVAGPDGRGPFSTNDYKNVKDRFYFREVWKTGKPVYSEALISKSTGKPVIVVAMPIKRGDKMVGMFGISLFISKIEEQAIDRKVLKSARYLMLGQDGRIILDFAGKYTGKFINKDLKDDGSKFAGLSELTGDLDNKFMEMIFDGKQKLLYSQKIATTGSYLVLLEDQDEFLEGINRQLMYVIIGIVLTIVVLMVLIQIITRLSSGPISRVIEIFKKIATGDLTVEVTDYVPDEFGELIRHLKMVLEKLRQIIHVALDSSRQLANSSEAFASTSSDLSQNAQSQAASVEEAAASLEEVSSSIDQIAVNAKDQSEFARETYKSMDELKRIVQEVSSYAAEALKMANNTTEEAQKGNELMQNTIFGMDSIDQSTKQIADIVKMIGDISEQVNLLSLNAAIEAARAGEHGKGFAVVADEISKLAEETAQSTRNINDLVKTGLAEVLKGKEYVDNTSKALFAIIENIQQTDQMVRKIADSARIQSEFSDKVVNDTRKVMEMSDSISASTDEQKNTNREMTSTIDQINQLTQSVAASAEEIASSSEEISAQTEALNKHIEFFKMET